MTSATLSQVKDRVLLIEDDEDVRRSLTMMLRARGYALDVYESGLELLSTGYLPDADCILIDYKMPKINGLQLLTRLREAGFFAPALLITGFYSHELEQKARDAGYAAVIEKPASADLLARSISDLTGSGASGG
ncbi:MAG: response regulator [Pseudomonadota bacterium]